MSVASTAADDPGSRAITALDDFMQAMSFVEMLAKETFETFGGAVHS